MRLILLGVRGSTPAPGADFVRYGGHTVCVGVVPDGADKPTLLLDAGTGARTLGDHLGGAAFRGTIVLSHLHWDHVQGIPFCRPVDRPDAVVRLLVPAQAGTSGRNLLAQLMAPPGFPITPEGLQGTWQFDALEPGRHEVEGFVLTAFEAQHKGGRTYGYRIEGPTGSVVYLPDHAPAAGCSDELIDALRAADVLLHDAQFLDHERDLARAYGHATVSDAVRLAEQAEVRSLVLFHHGPGRTDDEIDRIVASLSGTTQVAVVAARQGDVLDVAAG